MWQSWDKRLKKPLYTLSTMNNIFHDSNSNSNSSRIICRGHISHHGRWRWCWICLHNSSNIVWDTHAHYTWPPKSYGCNLHMMHCRSQHCWELLHPFAHHCQQGHGKSQHCEPNNVGSCCVLLHVALRFGLNVHVIRQKLWRCLFSICLIIRTFQRWVLLIMLYRIL